MVNHSQYMCLGSVYGVNDSVMPYTNPFVYVLPFTDTRYYQCTIRSQYVSPCTNGPAPVLSVYQLHPAVHGSVFENIFPCTNGSVPVSSVHMDSSAFSICERLPLAVYKYILNICIRSQMA
jgi:hypothetical protein